MASKPLDPIEKALRRKRKTIMDWMEQQKNIRINADAEIDALQRKIDREQILLDAIKRGALKP